jgi:hypothetical protein
MLEIKCKARYVYSTAGILLNTGRSKAVTIQKVNKEIEQKQPNDRNIIYVPWTGVELIQTEHIMVRSPTWDAATIYYNSTVEPLKWVQLALNESSRLDDLIDQLKETVPRISNTHTFTAYFVTLAIAILANMTFSGVIFFILRRKDSTCDPKATEKTEAETQGEDKMHEEDNMLTVLS